MKRRRKRRFICVPDKERSAARVRTFAEGAFVKNGLPAAYNPLLDERKIVQYGTINVRPRSSYDVNSNPKQTQRSNMGSIPGKHTSVSRMQSLAECFRNQVVSASVALNRERLASLVSTTD